MTIRIPYQSVPETAYPLDNAPWQADYPYKPRVTVALSHDGGSLHLHFRVEEDTVRAVAPADNGHVWEDSCCEFFCQLDDQGYYNFECNAAGTLLIGWGPTRQGREQAPQDVLKTVAREASLGRAPFSETKAPAVWELHLQIPVTAFWHHQIDTFNGRTLRANIYKCGDRLQRPHFLSLFPINTDHPDFHRPEFFQEVVCE